MQLRDFELVSQVGEEDIIATESYQQFEAMSTGKLGVRYVGVAPTPARST